MTQEDDTRHFPGIPGEGIASVHAVTGSTANIVAYNLAAIVAGRYRDGSVSTLLIDAEGYLSQEILPGVIGGSADEFGSYPFINVGSGLRILPYTERAAPTTERSLREQFDALIVACGYSQGGDWIVGADKVIVSGGTSRELEETLRNVEHMRRTDGVLLAPMGRLKLPKDSSEYPVFRLPSSRNAAFEQEQKTGEFAVLTNKEIGKAFEGLREGLLITRERTTRAPQGESVQFREEAETRPEDTPETSHQEHTGNQSTDERHTKRLSADQMVERMRQGAQRPDDSTSTPELEGLSAEPPKTRLQKLKSNIASLSETFSGKLRMSGGSGRKEVADADSSEEIERRLKLSLRETAVGGISRVCVGSPKGGVGKSSIAYALAGSVAYYTNLRVCLVDTDPNFGSMRLLVPRPVEHSVVSLAKDADNLEGLSDIRSYVAQNERMRLDVVLGPEHAHEMARLEDLGKAYGRIDSVLSKFYDLVVYDLGLGFRDPAIRRVLELSDELLFVTDSEVIPNAMLSDAIQYVGNLGVDLEKTTLVLNHRLPSSDESAIAPQVRNAHTSLLRRVTEVPYDARMSRLLNQRSFHIEDLSTPTRLGILTTVAACLEGLRNNYGSANKVVTQDSDEKRR